MLEVDLQAGDHAHAEALAGGPGLGEAVHGVVVRDGDGVEPQGGGLGDDSAGVCEPSEKLVWVCRSITPEPYHRPRRAKPQRARLARLRLRASVGAHPALWVRV